MAEIGYTTQGTAGTTTLENVIVGCIGTTGSEGTYTVQKIVAYINPSATQFTTKCAIYTTAGALVSNSETSVVTGISGAGWVDFIYSGTKPVLSASTTYVIVAWSQSRSGTDVISYDTLASNGRTVAATYGTYPASVTFTTNNNRASIYAVTTFAQTVSSADTLSQSDAVSTYFFAPTPLTQGVSDTNAGNWNDSEILGHGNIIKESLFSSTGVTSFYEDVTNDNSIPVSGGSTYSSVGISFVAGESGTLKQAKLKVGQSFSPTGSVYFKLYTCTSAVGGGNDIPSGSALATSDAIDVTTLPEGYATYYTATFSDGYRLVSGNSYVLVVEYTGGDATNRINFGFASSNTLAGNISGYNIGSSSWETIYESFADAPAGVYVDQEFLVDSEAHTLYEESNPVLSANVEDFLSLSDSLSLLYPTLFTNSDTLIISDNVNNLLTHYLTTSDSFSLIDEEKYLLGYGIVEEDTIPLTDVIGVEELLTTLLEITDNLILSDSTELFAQLLNLEEDQLVFSDSIELDFNTPDLTKFFSDLLTLTDTNGLSLSVDWFVAYSVQIVLEDSVIIGFETPEYTESTSDALQLTDEISVFSEYLLLVEDQLSLSEEINYYLTEEIVLLTISTSDALNLSDKLIGLFTHLLEVASGIGFLDSVNLDTQIVHIRYGIYDRFDVPWLDQVEGIQWPYWFAWFEHMELEDEVKLLSDWYISIEDSLMIEDSLDYTERESDDERYFRSYINDIEELLV